MKIAGTGVQSAHQAVGKKALWDVEREKVGRKQNRLAVQRGINLVYGYKFRPTNLVPQ